MRSLKFIILIVIISAAITFCGCTKEIVINHYPGFYDPNIRTVGVMPFANYSVRKGLGNMAAGHLAAGLGANRTYYVIGPDQIQTMLNKPTQSMPPESDFKALAQQLGKTGNMQAFIAGQVLGNSIVKASPRNKNKGQTPSLFNQAQAIQIHNKFTGNNMIHYAVFYGTPLVKKIDTFYNFDEPDYSFYPCWYYPGYYDYYYEFISYATIYINAWLVSIPHGNVIGSASENGTGVTESYAPMPPGFAVEQAIRDVTRKLVFDFAVVPVEAKINPSKDLKLADMQTNGRWHYTNNFKKTERIYVIICLPEAASQNHFTIRITGRKKDSPVFLEQDIVVSNQPCQTYEFPAEQIAGKGNGNYKVNIISAGQVIMKRNFKIK